MPGPAPAFSPVFAEDFRQQARCAIRLSLALYEELSSQNPTPLQVNQSSSLGVDIAPWEETHAYPNR